MRFSVHSIGTLVLAALVFLCRAGGAQAPTGVDAGPANATRQELERLAEQSDSTASEAIRIRLREGDFRAGDQIVLAVHGDTAFSDTVVVNPGRTLKVVSLPEDTLGGVLRSELQTHLTAWVTRYYRNATVRATPLIRFGVLGEVARPGYYRLPTDIPVTDAIMSAGGPTQRADMPKSILRRGSRELVSRSALRDAMVAGLTLGQLGVEGGDELVVGTKRERQWMTIVQVLTVVTGLVLSVQASRGF